MCAVCCILIIVYNLVMSPSPFHSFSCFSFPEVSFPDICRICLDAGIVLILHVNGLIQVSKYSLSTCHMSGIFARCREYCLQGVSVAGSMGTCSWKVHI